MDRRNGIVYDSTWILTKNYNYPLPLKWVYIITFNDFNEGTEMEPTIEYGYQYLDSTIQKVNQFKPDTIKLNVNRYTAAKQLYDAGNLIERHQRDSILCYPCYEEAIRAYIINDFSGSMGWSNNIIENNCNCPDNIRDVNDITSSIEVFPNPTDKRITVKINNNEINEIFYSLLIDTDGKTIQKLKLNKYNQTYEYHLDIKGLPVGVYYISIIDGKYKGLKKVIIK
ncbi:MAG: T9SS type A sorting domain-containing protein [Bacteroidetes bacterium]|nr:T9SS type A sorting domain-containing protein [Bacteroidota bacterium]